MKRKTDFDLSIKNLSTWQKTRKDNQKIKRNLVKPLKRSRRNGVSWINKKSLTSNEKLKKKPTKKRWKTNNLTESLEIDQGKATISDDNTIGLKVGCRSIDEKLSKT